MVRLRVAAFVAATAAAAVYASGPAWAPERHETTLYWNPPPVYIGIAATGITFKYEKPVVKVKKKQPKKVKKKWQKKRKKRSTTR